MADTNDSTGGTPTDSDTTPPAPSPTELQAELGVLRDEHEAYRERVHARAIQGYNEGNWSLSRLNDALTNLGLPRHEPKYISQSIALLSVRLEADARESVAAGNVMQQLERPEAQQAIREALIPIIEAHLTGPPTVTVPADALTLHVNTCRVVEV